MAYDRITRQERAERLYKRIKNGPSFTDPNNYGGAALNATEASTQYRRWAESWVLDELCDLIKELRDTTKEAK